MSNTYFRFKQFEVHHDRCAMKVSADGVLLGAWSQLEGNRILDIGSGSGVISLMVAQRNPRAMVWGIEIDKPSVIQARENVMASPFAERIHIIEGDVRMFQSEPFDTILCNPPFFNENTLPPDKARALARHAEYLPFEELMQSVSRLLSPDGIFHLVVPCSVVRDVLTAALSYGLYPSRSCRVRTVERKEPQRLLLSLSFNSGLTEKKEQIVLQNPDGSRACEFAQLMHDFYLDQI